MKIATWNIAGGHTLAGNGTEALRADYKEEDLGYFTEALRHPHIDLIALQEAHSPLHGEEPSQGDRIGVALGMHVAPCQPYGNSHIKEGQHLALATLSALPSPS
jgi:hypothetical protein